MGNGQHRACVTRGPTSWDSGGHVGQTYLPNGDGIVLKEEEDHEEAALVIFLQPAASAHLSHTRHSSLLRDHYDGDLRGWTGCAPRSVGSCPS